MAEDNASNASPMKREGPAQGPASKRPKVDESEDDIEEEVDPKCTPHEIAEIKKITKLLKQAYEDAPKATHNPFLYNRVCPVPWNLISYDMNPSLESDERRKVRTTVKTLANRLLTEEGWTAKRMIKIIGTSPMPIAILPLKRPESRALWESLRYRTRLNNTRSQAEFAIDIPEGWLTTKFQGKIFKASNALEYGKEIIAMVVFNQTKFLSTKPHWFRVNCDQLGWEFSAAFHDYLFPVLFMICAKPSAIKNLIQSTEGSWGKSGTQKKVKKLFKESAIAAEKESSIKYKQAFNLLKVLRPNLLK
jgi:hypothetical protein